MLRVLQRDGVALRTSAGVVARAWRNGRRQANLPRVLRGIETVPLDEAAAGKSATSADRVAPATFSTPSGAMLIDAD
jgi:hypothetical protein